MDNRTIKQNIAAFRKRLGMTQEQMAELIHISTTAYRDLEKGNTVILSEKIIDMAARTGFSVEEIIQEKPFRTEDVGCLENAQKEYGSQNGDIRQEVERLRQESEHFRQEADYLRQINQLQSQMISDKDDIIKMLKRSLEEIRSSQPSNE
ncbi:MAG: helix-turn-helix domain-containing protein [Bacteroidales bacterium]|nr:helix-turn-helix domain-containing protein [Bacteroidales bacterium]